MCIKRKLFPETPPESFAPTVPVYDETKLKKNTLGNDNNNIVIVKDENQSTIRPTIPPTFLVTLILKFSPQAIFVKKSPASDDLQKKEEKPHLSTSNGCNFLIYYPN